MKENKNTPIESEVMAAPRASDDFRTAILIVSVVANLFVFTAWLMLQVTTQYDSQFMNLLFNR